MRMRSFYTVECVCLLCFRGTDSFDYFPKASRQAMLSSDAAENKDSTIGLNS